MNANANFCQDFNFEDPDKIYTDIAFLIVCDMHLTGFDAPVEQVMYIDKRIKEHNLLQAIARTDRIKKERVYCRLYRPVQLFNRSPDSLCCYR